MTLESSKPENLSQPAHVEARNLFSSYDVKFSEFVDKIDKGRIELELVTERHQVAGGLIFSQLEEEQGSLSVKAQDAINKLKSLEKEKGYVEVVGIEDFKLLDEIKKEEK